MKIKKIVTKTDLQEKDKKMKIWLTVFIVVIMAASTAGFALNFSSENNGQTRTYNGLKFSITDRGWQPKGYSIYTSYLPQDVENVSLSGNFVAKDFNAKAYLISPPYLQNDVLEFLKYLPITNLQQACLKEDENVSYCSNVPIRSCADATSQSAVIIVKEGNQSSVNYKGYCLEITSDSGNMIKVADRALFKAYGIM